MSEPARIQRRRTKGWRMPEGAVYVGRTAGHSQWSNPFVVGGYFRLGGSFGGGLSLAWLQTYRDPPEDGFTRIVDRQMAVDWFRLLAADWHPLRLEKCRRELRGHDLCCWCPLDQPCHADVLLELANQ